MHELVIRAPNHLGDLVMALPALHEARPDAVIAPKGLGSLIELAGFRPIPHETPLATAKHLRKLAFGRGILFTPSFSTALTLALGRVKERRGTNTDNRGFLLTNKVDPALLAHTHRSAVYWLLATGELPATRPVPSLAISSDLKHEFEELVPAGPAQKRIGIFPGSNAPARRWGAERFAELVTKLTPTHQVVVFGGPDEKELTSAVAGDIALDLGGRTSLSLLAAGLASCDLVVSNDSGPLHLAAAVGTQTVSLWGAGDPARTGPPPGHVVLRDRRLPCLECVKNQCPRSGPGYILPDAYMECMQLIPVDDVLTSVNA
ncbi:MAG TPA: glycosyltransferase family 9 protein [Longimicrobiales bacterium]